MQFAGATIQAIDSATSTQRVNSPIATTIAQVNTAWYDPSFLVANGAPVAVTLPATTIWNIVIKNLSGTATVSVVMTPAGGAPWASPLVIPPNGFVAMAATFASNPASGGITALSLGSSAANTYIELTMGG